MKIALIGYGKMGRAIEEIATQKGHSIILKITSANTHDVNITNLQKADVAIEFTGPGSAFKNIQSCLDAGIPVISGSTGWLDKIETIYEQCELRNGTFLYASNFSIGVNIFFELNKELAALMAAHEEYDVTIEEIHHTQKKDAPSGTAITLAEQVLEKIKRKKNWSLEPASTTELTITSKRIDPAPGTHHVKYHSVVDDIEIIHTAHSRQGFANGALLAAEFLNNKKGIYTMKDVLGIN